MAKLNENIWEKFTKQDTLKFIDVNDYILVAEQIIKGENEEINTNLNTILTKTDELTKLIANGNKLTREFYNSVLDVVAISGIKIDTEFESEEKLYKDLVRKELPKADKMLVKDLHSQVVEKHQEINLNIDKSVEATKAEYEASLGRTR